MQRKKKKRKKPKRTKDAYPPGMLSLVTLLHSLSFSLLNFPLPVRVAVIAAFDDDDVAAAAAAAAAVAAAVADDDATFDDPIFDVKLLSTSAAAPP